MSLNWDNDRQQWTRLRGEERLAREDAERSALLTRLVRTEDEQRVRQTVTCQCGAPVVVRVSGNAVSGQCRECRSETAKAREAARKHKAVTR